MLTDYKFRWINRLDEKEHAPNGRTEAHVVFFAGEIETQSLVDFATEQIIEKQVYVRKQILLEKVFVFDEIVPDDELRAYLNEELVKDKKDQPHPAQAVKRASIVVESDKSFNLTEDKRELKAQAVKER